MGYYTVWFKKKNNPHYIFKSVQVATGYADACKKFWKDHSENECEICYVNDYV